MSNHLPSVYVLLRESPPLLVTGWSFSSTSVSLPSSFVTTWMLLKWSNSGKKALVSIATILLRKKKKTFSTLKKLKTSVLFKTIRRKNCFYTFYYESFNSMMKWDPQYDRGDSIGCMKHISIILIIKSEYIFIMLCKWLFDSNTDRYSGSKQCIEIL